MLKNEIETKQRDHTFGAHQCELCGVTTDRWTYYNGKTGKCWCVACRDAGKWPV